MATTVVLLVAGVGLYLLVRAQLLGQFDDSLVDDARMLSSVAELEGEVLDLGFHDLDMSEFSSPRHNGYLQLWWDNGDVAYRSESLGEDDLGHESDYGEWPVCRWVTLPGGERGRALGMRFKPWVDVEAEGHKEWEIEEGMLISKPAGAEGLRLVLAEDAGPILDALRPLRWLLIVLGVATVAISSATLWVVISRNLRPLERTAKEIGRLGDENLSERIEVKRIPLELRPVVVQFNDLLGRIEAAFEREREFTGDAAHELRTPLAGLRTTLEVAVSRVRGVEEYEGAIAECLGIVEQMQRMTENLLLLARLESGRVEIVKEKVDLNELIRNIWRQFAEQAEKRDLQVEWALAENAEVMTDGALMVLMARNMLENAVLYANEGGTVTIGSGCDGGRASIAVSNTGSMVAAEAAERVFERYWRGDRARSEAVTHCGLGLPLVKKIAAILGGEVEVESEAGGVFRISVSVAGS